MLQNMGKMQLNEIEKVTTINILSKVYTIRYSYGSRAENRVMKTVTFGVSIHST